MTDDPFRRPDVRALLEAVAAGDDPSARLVLWDALAEAGADQGFVAWCRELVHLGFPAPAPDRRAVTFWRESQFGSAIVHLRDRIGRRTRPRTYPSVLWPDEWPAGGLRLAAALAAAADRLAARAAPAPDARTPAGGGYPCAPRNGVTEC